MPVRSVQWAEALDPLVASWFEQGLSRRQAVVPQLYNVSSSENSDEQLGNIGAVSADSWDEYEDSGQVPQVDFDKGYLKTFTHLEYPLELRIQRKFLDDNKYPQITNAAFRLGDSATLKREVDGAATFINAFDSTFAGPDGVELCDSAHPNSPDNTGTTQGNVGTSAFSEAAVRSTRIAMMKFTDDKGGRMGVTPNLLLIPPDLEDEAIEVVRAVSLPDTADNNANPQSGRWSVLVWNQLTNTKDWWMIDANLMRQSLFWFDRMPLSIVPKVEDKTISASWIAYMRYSLGWADWRWVYGHNVT